MTSELDLRQLRYLVTLAQQRSVTRAAARLGISQPALSEAVRNFERRVGVSLFDRIARGVHLTPAGREFIVYASAVLDAAEDAGAAAERLARERAGEMVIAFIPGLMPIAGHLVPELRAAGPGLKIRLKEIPQRLLGQELASGAADLGLGSPTVTGRHLASVPILRVPLLVLITESHPLAAEDRLTVEQLSATRMVGPWASALPDGHGPGESRPCERSVSRVIEGIDELWPTVQSGASVALVPDFLVKRYAIEGVTGRPLATPAATAVVAAYRQDDMRPLTREAANLVAGQQL